VRRAAETLWVGLLCVAWALFGVAAVFGVIEIARAGAPHFSAVEIVLGAAASIALCVAGMKLVGELWDRGRRIGELHQHQADAIARAREFEALEAVYAQQAESQEEAVEELRKALAERDAVVDRLRGRIAELRPQELRRTA
jgi:DNA-directed RNA polymerase subunit F